MNYRMFFVVKADPIPASRPRHSGKHTYNPARNVEYRNVVQWFARVAMNGAEPFTSSLAVKVKLFRKVSPVSRAFGDADNHLKALFDALNKIVFVDDSQIVSCEVEKFQDKENPRTEIYISEVKGTSK